jgi:hypothetical protein
MLHHGLNTLSIFSLRDEGFGDRCRPGTLAISLVFSALFDALHALKSNEIEVDERTPALTRGHGSALLAYSASSRVRQGSKKRTNPFDRVIGKVQRQVLAVACALRTCTVRM